MQKITRNTFEKGLNTDIESSKIEPVQYTDAHNVEIVGDGEFLSLRNIKGTESVQAVTNAVNAEVIGVFENTYLINGVAKKCLTVFTVENYTALSATSGSYLFSGSPANLIYAAGAGSKTMSASPGGFSFTGQTVNENVAYTFLLKGVGSTTGEACAIDLASGGSFIYSDVDELGSFVVPDTVVYSDVYLSTPFSGPGYGTFYKIRKYTGTTTTYAIEIDTDGKVLSLSSCV